MNLVKFADVIDVNPHRKLEKGELSPYVPMANLVEGKRTIQDIDFREYKNSGSKFINGDTLLARITPCLENGKTAFVNKLKGNQVAHGSTEFIVLRGKAGITDNLFVYYLIRSTNFRNIAIKSMTGSSGRQRVQISAIENYEFELPSLEEQKRIAHILGALDDKIELNQRMNETLEEIARAIFKSWFVDFDPVRAKMAGKPHPLPDEVMALFPDRLVESELGMIPKGWEVGKLGEEFKVVMGQSPPGSSYNEEGKGISFFQGRTDFGFRYPNKRVFCTEPKRFAEVGDTLISVRAPVGDINMAIERCCIGRGVAAVKHKSGRNSYTYYSMMDLNRKFKIFEAEGTVFGSIGKNEFNSLSIIVPSHMLIKIFEKYIEPNDEMILNNDINNEDINDIRNSLSTFWFED
ncbi:MAG: restriction endonuclease subunit S [Anaerolineaceae bacterium]|nr:restriction endonuclease subunit S [Anaerolineaceae bacterium]